ADLQAEPFPRGPNVGSGRDLRRRGECRRRDQPPLSGLAAGNLTPARPSGVSLRPRKDRPMPTRHAVDLRRLLPLLCLAFLLAPTPGAAARQAAADAVPAVLTLPFELGSN